MKEKARNISENKYRYKEDKIYKRHKLLASAKRVKLKYALDLLF